MPTNPEEPLPLLNILEAPSGVYRLDSRARPTPILATITDLGWYAGYINGKIVYDKQTFLQAAGQALAFPDYYGRNWDAFEEMVRDLSWINAAGYGLLVDQVYRFASAQPEEWETALSILNSASKWWSQQGIPFYVLLRQNWRWNRHLPKLAV